MDSASSEEPREIRDDEEKAEKGETKSDQWQVR
jgi:hypothetical protein